MDLPVCLPQRYRCGRCRFCPLQGSTCNTFHPFPAHHCPTTGGLPTEYPPVSGCNHDLSVASRHGTQPLNHRWRRRDSLSFHIRRRCHRRLRQRPSRGMGRCKVCRSIRGLMGLPCNQMAIDILFLSLLLGFFIYWI